MASTGYGPSKRINFDGDERKYELWEIKFMGYMRLKKLHEIIAMAFRLDRELKMDVVVVGSCMIDLVSYVPRLPKPGETLHGDKFCIGYGGKGANQCVAAARLGAKTAMVAKVGVDTFGDGYLKNFKDNGVNIDHVQQTDEAFSGVAPIAVNTEGQNSIIIVSGANHKLTRGDVMRAEPLIGQSKILVCQLEILPEVTLAALQLARRHGVTTILNPAPAPESLPDLMLQNCDIFCPNETEAELLTGLPVTCLAEAEVAAKRLLSRGPGRIVITLGGEGALTIAAGEEKATHVPAEKVQPVDTTGAGDAFVGALAYYLTNHPRLSITASIRRACQIATVSVQRPGTQTSYPGRDQLPASMFS